MYNDGAVLPVARPRAQAIFPYQALNGDELTLKPAQFITIIEKMTDGWWRGELDDGTIGVFPFNYVKVRVWSAGRPFFAVSSTIPINLMACASTLTFSPAAGAATRARTVHLHGSAGR